MLSHVQCEDGVGTGGLRVHVGAGGGSRQCPVTKAGHGFVAIAYGFCSGPHGENLPAGVLVDLNLGLLLYGGEEVTGLSEGRFYGVEKRGGMSREWVYPHVFSWS